MNKASFIATPARRPGAGSRRAWQRASCLLLIFLLLQGVLSLLQAQAPRLVVIVVIDQMRADYLERFHDGFAPGGFNLLLGEGAVFANCQYGYDATETAPGHAVLSTGSYARHNGIVGNFWYDRGSGKVVSAVADEGHPLVGGARQDSPGASPWALQGATLGDELRSSSRGASRVVSLSWKDRAAVLLGGKNPTAAFWFDAASGGFATSTYYMASLPAWVGQFNRDHKLENFAGRSWRPVEEKPGKPAESFERRLNVAPDSGSRAAFWADFATTPFAMEMEFQLAESAVENYHLGERETTDLLLLSISPPDFLGHQVGPDSPLVRDMFLRLDRRMAEFFRFLERRVGLRRTVLALSADHGVAPLPEHAQAERLGGGRVNSTALTNRIRGALAQRFGPGEPGVQGYVFPRLYLNHEAIQKRNLALQEVIAAAGEAALQEPGVAAYYTAAELADFSGQDPLLALYARGYYPERGGDLVLRYAPYFIPDYAGGGTTHASPYSYDRRVPLILRGTDFRAGVYYNEAAPADLAPTLAAVLKINPPAMATGRILSEALAPRKAAVRPAAPAAPASPGATSR